MPRPHLKPFQTLYPEKLSNGNWRAASGTRTVWPSRPANMPGLIVDQRGIDVVVQVIRPDGTVLADFNREARKDGREPAGVVADQATVYELRIKARYAKDPPGEYILCLSELHLATDAGGGDFEMHKLGVAAAKLDDEGKRHAAFNSPAGPWQLERSWRPTIPTSEMYC